MVIVGTVQGLVAEKEKVKEAFGIIDPVVVALPISEEGLEGLEACINGKVSEAETDSHEDLFAKHLKRFGEVQIPPPSLVEAYERAQVLDARIVAIDMPEEDYVKAYMDKVTGFHFWKRIWSESRLRKQSFVADTPEEFVVMWDHYVNEKKGYGKLEKARESYMAAKIYELLQEHEKVLVLLEHERLDGVLEEIRKLWEGPDDENAVTSNPNDKSDENTRDFDE